MAQEQPRKKHHTTNSILICLTKELSLGWNLKAVQSLLPNHNKISFFFFWTSDYAYATIMWERITFCVPNFPRKNFLLPYCTLTILTSGWDLHTEEDPHRLRRSGIKPRYVLIIPRRESVETPPTSPGCGDANGIHLKSNKDRFFSADFGESLRKRRGNVRKMRA